MNDHVMNPLGLRLGLGNTRPLLNLTIPVFVISFVTTPVSGMPIPSEELSVPCLFAIQRVRGFLTFQLPGLEDPSADCSSWSEILGISLLGKSWDFFSESSSSMFLEIA